MFEWLYFIGHLIGICKKWFHCPFKFFLVECTFFKKAMLLYSIVNGKLNWHENYLCVKFETTVFNGNILADKSIKSLIQNPIFHFLITYEVQSVSICLTLIQSFLLYGFCNKV